MVMTRPEGNVDNYDDIFQCFDTISQVLGDKKSIHPEKNPAVAFPNLQ